MQLLASRGLEFGATPGLDWIAGDVKRIEPGDPPSRSRTWAGTRSPTLSRTPLLVRHRGARPRLFRALLRARRADPETVLAATDYGGPITAMVGRDNLAGTQFHPEKSQATGLR